jgi:hypothetical protein
MRSRALYFALLFVALTDLADAHCLGFQPKETPIRLLMFFDRSNSVGSESGPAFLKAARESIACLLPGDSAAVFTIEAASARSETLLDLDFRTTAAPAALTTKITIQNEALKKRRELSAAVEALLARPSDARATDILGAFERVAKDPARKTIALFFTDGLHASANGTGLNLESTAIRRETVPGLVAQIINRQGWKRESLAGVTVVFVLPPAKRKPTVMPKNDDPTLKLFYDMLIARIGGKLAAFSVDLPNSVADETSEPKR